MILNHNKSSFQAFFVVLTSSFLLLHGSPFIRKLKWPAMKVYLFLLLESSFETPQLSTCYWVGWGCHRHRLHCLCEIATQTIRTSFFRPKINLTVPQAVFPSRAIWLVVAFQHSSENTHSLRQSSETRSFLIDMSCLTCRPNGFFSYVRQGDLIFLKSL